MPKLRLPTLLPRTFRQPSALLRFTHDGALCKYNEHLLRSVRDRGHSRQFLLAAPLTTYEACDCHRRRQLHARCQIQRKTFRRFFRQPSANLPRYCNLRYVRNLPRILPRTFREPSAACILERTVNEQASKEFQQRATKTRCRGFFSSII